MKSRRQTKKSNRRHQHPSDVEENTDSQHLLDLDLKLKESMEEDTIVSSSAVHDTHIISESLSNLQLSSNAKFTIFSCLSLKTLFKLKSLSQEFSNLMTDPIFALHHFRRLQAQTHFTGFFCQNIPESLMYWSRYFNVKKNGNPEFVPAETDKGSSCLYETSLDFLKHPREVEDVRIVDSCNGLLLCVLVNNDKNKKIYYVCNPLTKQSVLLPHPGKRSTRLHYALIADPTQTGYLRYKVFCVCRSKLGRPCSKLSIFSSQTGQWKELKDRLPVMSDDTMIGSKVFFNGALFWDCLEGYILVCHLNREDRGFELINAPEAQLGRCLWDYNGKLLCYCNQYEEFDFGFPSWYLCFRENKFEWKMEDSKQFETLSEDVWRGYWEHHGEEVRKVPQRIRFKIIAYNPNSQTVFLWISDSIFSYELKKRKFQWVWGFSSRKFDTQGYALPYIHSLVPIEIGRISIEGTKT